MYKIIEEGKAQIKVPKEGKISRELPVFYNPVMEFNRTVSVLLFKAYGRKMQIGLPLGGSGVRAVRFLKEVPKSLIKEVWINDIDKEAVKIIKANLKMNKVKAKVFNKDANMFMLESQGFDYVDIEGKLIFQACRYPNKRFMLRRPDISLAKKLFSWEPKVPLDDGIKETLEYFKNTMD